MVLRFVLVPDPDMGIPVRKEYHEKTFYEVPD